MIKKFLCDYAPFLGFCCWIFLSQNYDYYSQYNLSRIQSFFIQEIIVLISMILTFMASLLDKEKDKSLFIGMLIYFIIVSYSNYLCIYIY